MLILVRFPKRRLANCSVLFCEIYVQRLTVFSEDASDVKKKVFSKIGTELLEIVRPSASFFFHESHEL